MHIRKKYLIYPPNYRPECGRYKVRYSKRQAWKVAARMGVGAVVEVSITYYTRPRTPWVSSHGVNLWEVASGLWSP